MACEAKVVAVASPSQLMTSIAYTHLDLPASSGGLGPQNATRAQVR